MLQAELNIARLGEAFWRAQAVRLEAELAAERAKVAALTPKEPPAK
jgi:hypothetical protein